MTKLVSDFIPLLAGLALGLVFLYLTFAQLEWDSLLRALSLASVGPFALGFLLLAADFLVRIARWWSLLRVFVPRLTWRACAGPYLASFAVNNLLPFRAGDVLRAVGFRDELQSPTMRILGIMFIERWLDLCVLIGFLFFGLLNLPESILAQSFARAGVWLALLCLVAALAVLIIPKWVQRGFRWVTGWPALRHRPLTIHVERWVDQFISALLLFRKPVLMLRVIGMSILIWTLEGAIYAVVASSLGINAGIFVPWFSLAAGTLATLLPSAPGHVGTFEYFATLALVAHGATKERAVVFALIVHAILWLPITIAGGLHLATSRGRMLRRYIRLAPGT